MYVVTQNGKFVGYSETVVWVKFHTNGAYVECPVQDAEGFCVKLASLDEEGEVIVNDTVYCLEGHEMTGTEQTAEVADIVGTNWAEMLYERDQALTILGVTVDE